MKTAIIALILLAATTASATDYSKPGRVPWGGGGIRAMVVAGDHHVEAKGEKLGFIDSIKTNFHTRRDVSQNASVASDVGSGVTALLDAVVGK